MTRKTNLDLAMETADKLREALAPVVAADADVWDIRAATKEIGGRCGWSREDLEVVRKTANRLEFVVYMPPRQRGQEPRYRFGLAHALGHWILHMNRPGKEIDSWVDNCVEVQRSGWPGTYTAAEMEANNFAWALLMPEARFRQVANGLKTERGTYPCAAIGEVFGVSTESAMARGRHLGMFSWR